MSSEGKNKKVIIYALTALLVFSVSFYLLQRSNYDQLRASVIDILEDMIKDSLPLAPDLEIESVYLSKTKNPTYDFNYYKYDATVIIANHGGDLLNSVTKISAGDTQEHKFVKNNETGFSLKAGEKYILKNYEVIFDGKYNGGEITFTLETTSKYQKDSNSKNDTYTAKILEEPARIENIGIKEILDDGTIVLNFEPTYYYLNENNFEVLVSSNAEVSEDDLKYAEIEKDGNIYEYYRTKNSADILANKNFQGTSLNFSDAHFVKFGNDPFVAEKTYYLYIKGINPETKNYIFSNVLVFPAQEKLNRAEFAKIFVEETGAPIFDDGEMLFEDIEQNAWYLPYVETVYNLGLFGGLTEKQFNPDQSLTRGEALKIVMDYYDSDLRISKEQKYQDIDADNDFAPYVGSFSESGKDSFMGENFYPDLPCGKNFLKNLIHGYQENN